jgi:hypothetical protein
LGKVCVLRSGDLCCQVQPWVKCVFLEVVSGKAKEGFKLLIIHLYSIPLLS